jgi:hypothetical protein
VTQPDDKLETIPITEQIDARVSDAVDEIQREQKRDPMTGQPIVEPPPLELAMPVPREVVHTLPKTPLLTILHRGLMKSLKWVILAVVLAVAAGAFLAFTKTGRALLPKSMQGEAKKMAAEVEQRARDVTEEKLYTYTDDQGVVHIVDELEKVPPQFRKRATKR